MGSALSQPAVGYKEADLQQFLKTNSCQGCDLTEVNQERANIYRVMPLKEEINKYPWVVLCRTTMPDGKKNNSDC